MKEFLKNIDVLHWKGENNWGEKTIIICQILSIVFSSIIIILSRIISFDGEISRSISNELIDNFETGFFMNFSNASSGGLVKFGSWQGSVKGCGKIKGGIKQAIILDQGKNCKEGEEYIDEISPQDLFVYKSFSFSASTKGKYIDLLLKDNDSIIEEFGECSQNKRVCGYIDTLKNKLCLDKNLPCPISYIKIQENKPLNIENLITINGVKANFYFSNNPYPNTGEIPYIANSFKIADSIICALPNLYYSSISLSELDGFKNKYSTNCVLTDYSQRVTVDKSRYHEIDTIDNYELYEENKIIDKIKKNTKLIEYGYDIEKFKNHRLSLYIRTHFGFNQKCLKEMHFEPDWLVYIYGQADNMIIFGNFALASIALIGVSVLNFFNFCHSSLEFLIKYSINLASSGGLSVYSFYAVGFDDYYEKEMKCSDVITNNNYNIMIYKIKRSGNIILMILIFYILLVLVNIFSLIIQFCREAKKNGNKKQDKVDYNKLTEMNKKDDKENQLIPNDEENNENKEEKNNNNN